MLFKVAVIPTGQYPCRPSWELPLASEVCATGAVEGLEVGIPRLHPELVPCLCAFVAGGKTIRRDQENADHNPSRTARGFARVRRVRTLPEALGCAKCVCRGAVDT